MHGSNIQFLLRRGGCAAGGSCFLALSAGKIVWCRSSRECLPRNEQGTNKTEQELNEMEQNKVFYLTLLFTKIDVLMLLWASGDVVELRLAAGGRRLGATAVGGFPRAVDSDNDSSVLRDAWRAEVVIEGDGPCIPVHTDEIEVESLSTDEKRTVSKDSTHPVTLARPERPYDRLVVRANGADAAFASQLAGGGGASTKTRASASLFVPEIDYNRTNPSSAEVVVYFRSTVKQVTPQQQPHACYLGVDVASGIWCAGPKLTEEEHVKGSRSTFYCGFMVMKSPKVLRLGDTAAPPRPPSSSTSSYVDEQGKFFVPSWKMRRFEREGYVVLSGHVPEPELRGCQRMLTRLLGVPGALVAGVTQLC